MSSDRLNAIQGRVIQYVSVNAGHRTRQQDRFTGRIEKTCAGSRPQETSSSPSHITNRRSARGTPIGVILSDFWGRFPDGCGLCCCSHEIREHGSDWEPCWSSATRPLLKNGVGLGSCGAIEGCIGVMPRRISWGYKGPPLPCYPQLFSTIAVGWEGQG